MKKIKIMSVVGARPNFMKIGPFVAALNKCSDKVEHSLVHTGQHYDEAMSGSFFGALGIPAPDLNLEVGSGSHAEQVGRTMIAFEPVLKEHRPDWVVVVGDVNATCACSLAAAKENIRVAHIEAGLRSDDRSMPEEINRLVTDRLSSLLLTPDEMAGRNLLDEGVSPDRIKCVGNIMIDTLEAQRETAAALNIGDITGSPEHRDGQYAVLTLHRPSNVDDAKTLSALVAFFVEELSSKVSLVWTIHPRTRTCLEAAGLWNDVCSAQGITLLEPLGYRELLRLNMGAKIMLTDSGGLQEETCVLGTPCITLRANTERPVTLKENGGTCQLAGNDVPTIRKLFLEMQDQPRKEARPSLWDGHTAERIVASILSACEDT